MPGADEKNAPFAGGLEDACVDGLVRAARCPYACAGLERARPSPAVARRRQGGRRGPEVRALRVALRPGGADCREPEAAYPGPRDVDRADASRDLSAKKGLPPDAACSCPSVARLSWTSARSRSSRSSVSMFNGPTASCSNRSSGSASSVRAGAIRLPPPGDEQADRRLSEPTGDELERTRRRRVEPLDVVDGQENRSGLGQRAHDAEEAQRDGARLRRGAFGLPPEQRNLERVPLRFGEPRHRFGRDVLQQVAERGERELRLRIDRPADQDEVGPLRRWRRLASRASSCRSLPRPRVRDLPDAPRRRRGIYPASRAPLTSDDRLRLARTFEAPPCTDANPCDWSVTACRDQPQVWPEGHRPEP